MVLSVCVQTCEFETYFKPDLAVAAQVRLIICGEAHQSYRLALNNYKAKMI